MNKEKRLYDYKKDFPLFLNYPELVYLDSAATSQKPFSVIESVKQFYENSNANIHRGIYSLSQLATDLFESSRKKIANFIGAADPSEIIFTSNASEAMNLVSYGWAKKFLKKGDIIITTEMEHHSNIVPWLQLQKEIGIILHFLPIDKNYRLDYKNLVNADIDLGKVRLITLCHASNVLGTINPVKDIIHFMRSNNIQAKFLIDAAQSIPHIPVNVQDIGCDFIAFSSHKMLGPSGVGVLWAKKDILHDMDPLFTGSHMIKTVSKSGAVWADIPDKFETGTRNLEGVIGLAAAIDYLNGIGMDVIGEQEKDLTDYALDALLRTKSIKLFGPHGTGNRLGVFSFTVGTVHPHDTAEIFNRLSIAVRSGHHCAQTLMHVLQQTATVRASLYLYNTRQDIDSLLQGIDLVKKTFSV